jgi:hypothetical protein
VSGICWEGTAHPCEHHYVNLQTSDTRLSVYEENCFNGDASSFLCVSGDDSFCGAQSLVTFEALAGGQYYIIVHGFGIFSGNSIVSLTML